MAIQGNYNFDKAKASESYAYQCWYNYNYGNNTMNIPDDEIYDITATWSSSLKKWSTCAQYAQDNNEYDFADIYDINTAKLEAVKQVKEETGNVNTAKTKANAASSATLSAGTAAATAVTYHFASKAGIQFTQNLGEKAVEAAAKKAGEKAAEEGAKKGAEEGAKKAAEEGAKKGAEEAATQTTQQTAQQTAQEGSKKAAGAAKLGAYIAVAIAAANVVKYLATKPNEKEKKACDELQNVMVDSQNGLAATQSDMDNMQDELITLNEEAVTINEEGNESIDDQKVEFDTYKATVEELVLKQQSGAKLTSEEQALLAELVPLMQELGEGITTTFSETGEVVGDIYSDMETYEDGYANAQITVEEIASVTEYAESVDTPAKISCYTEAGSQGLNAISATMAASKLVGSGPWGWAAAALGFASAASSGVFVGKQMSMASAIGTEQDMRKDTQALNVETNDIRLESVDNYDFQLTSVDELELIVPKEEEIEVSEEIISITSGDSGGSQSGTSQTTLGTAGTGASSDGTGAIQKDKELK